MGASLSNRFSSAHTNSQIINKQSLSLVRKSQTAKLYVNKVTQQEYALIQYYTSINGSQIKGNLIHNITNYLTKRVTTPSQYIPAIASIQDNNSNICTTVPCLNIWMKHPARSLQQEIKQRQLRKQQFGEGELWMIIYSALNALVYYEALGIGGVRVKVSSQTLFIHKNGDILLSDCQLFKNDCSGYFWSGCQQFTDDVKVKNGKTMNNNMIRISASKNIRNIVQIVRKLMSVQGVETNKNQAQNKHSIYLEQLLKKLEQKDSDKQNEQINYRKASAYVLHYRNMLQKPKILSTSASAKSHMETRNKHKNSTKFANKNKSSFILLRNTNQINMKTAQIQSEVNSNRHIEKGLKTQKNNSFEASPNPDRCVHEGIEQQKFQDSILRCIQSKYNFPFEQIYRQIENKFHINFSDVQTRVKVSDKSTQNNKNDRKLGNNEMFTFCNEQISGNLKACQYENKPEIFIEQNRSRQSQINQQLQPYSQQQQQLIQQISEYSTIRTDPQLENNSKDCTLNAVVQTQISKLNSVLSQKNKQFLQTLISKQKNPILQVQQSQFDQSTLNYSKMCVKPAQVSSYSYYESCFTINTIKSLHTIVDCESSHQSLKIPKRNELKQTI